MSRYAFAKTDGNHRVMAETMTLPVSYAARCLAHVASSLRPPR